MLLFFLLLSDFFEDYKQNHPNTETVIIYSDSCGYQNKNATLANTMMMLSQKLHITIIHNCLEKGHTQMEIDSAHSLIEKRLKNRDIYLPTNYIAICREARPSNPFLVTYLQFNDFKDYSHLKNIRSIRPGYKAGDLTVSDLKCLKFVPGCQVFFKSSYNLDWEMSPKRSFSTLIEHDSPPRKLFNQRLKIKADKFKNLQDLRPVLDKTFWEYYNNIPHH